MADEMPQGPTAVRLELTVPCDPRFRDLLAAVSRRMAAYIGYADADADVVAETVLQATGGLFGGDAPAASASLDLTFATSDREMEILLRYVRKERQVLPDEHDMQHVLCRGGERGAPIDAMRRVMECVEFGRQDGVEFCRMTRQLPRAPSGQV